MRIDPEGIHIMIAEDHTNIFHVDINSDHRMEYNGHVLDRSLTKVIRGSKRLEDGSILDGNGEKLDINRIRVMASIQPEEIEMTDDQDAGLIQGTISNMIYLGEYYSYVVHTEMGQDFIVYDEDLWNMDDRVSLIVPDKKLKLTMKMKK